MFERFTERAREVIVLAQEEARLLKQGYIGSEHILLGLLREEEGIAARVLESLDVTVERVRVHVIRICGSSEEVICGQLPFTPRAKKLLELGLREGISLGHNYIGTEHVLLGLARENDGVASRVLLEEFDVDSEQLRDEVLRMLGLPGGPSSGELDALLDGAQELLGIVAGEIEERLGRPADASDLLVVLSSIPAGLAARTLALVGVDATALARAGDEARRSGDRSGLRPPREFVAELEKIRTEKKAAMQTAAHLRDRERELTEQIRKTVEQQQEEALNEIRGRLGLTHE